MIDGYGRTIDYLRISVTDRCDLRCLYCMPGSGAEMLSHEDILRFEEIGRIVRVMAPLGFSHLRITGGEPTVRRGLWPFLSTLRGIEGVESIGMTTNGMQGAEGIDAARAAGLTSVNLSLDALSPALYRRITRTGDVSRVLQALGRALETGLPVKLNCVPVRGLNEDELVPIAALAKERPVSVRFIELMPLGCAKALQAVPQSEVLARLEAAFGPSEADPARRGHGPAHYVSFPGFSGSIGFIDALSHSFCARCNRVRLTADGLLKLCLNHTAELDLRALLRAGISDAALSKAIADAVRDKPACHEFHQPGRDAETRRMNEIGG